MKDIWSLLCWRAFMNISLNTHVKEKMEFLYVSSWDFALLACCIYRGWSSEAHLKYTWTYSCACTSKNNPCALAFVAYGCKKCVFPSEECSEEHSLLSSHWRQPTWGCNTAVLVVAGCDGVTSSLSKLYFHQNVLKNILSL